MRVRCSAARRLLGPVHQPMQPRCLSGGCFIWPPAPQRRELSDARTDPDALNRKRGLTQVGRSAGRQVDQLAARSLGPGERRTGLVRGSWLAGGRLRLSFDAVDVRVASPGKAENQRACECRLDPRITARALFAYTASRETGGTATADREWSRDAQHARPVNSCRVAGRSRQRQHIFGQPPHAGQALLLARHLAILLLLASAPARSQACAAGRACDLPASLVPERVSRASLTSC